MSYTGIAELFGVYWPARDEIYLVPVNDVPKSRGWLRLEPTRNNQQKGVRMAADYEFSTWTTQRLLELASPRQSDTEYLRIPRAVARALTTV
jgi:hypothetical protein